MATKNRSSRRQKRVPLKFFYHVMKYVSKKSNDVEVLEDTEQVRSTVNEIVNKIGEENKGVFGNEVNEHDCKKLCKVNDECTNEDSSSGIDRENGFDNGGVADVCDRNLECIPIVVDKDGIEVVVFDEVMVVEGSKKWDLTMCGFFVGLKMSFNELRYNLKRMWRKYGFKDVVDYNNAVYFIKFHHEEETEQIVNNGPWMIPMWVKLCNVPLEAWTVKGISALASRLGKPLVMDSVTAQIKYNEEKNTSKVPTEPEVKDVGGEKGFDSGKNKWSVHKDIVDAMKKYANKFSVFGMYDINEQNELTELKHMEIVDAFLNKKKCELRVDKGYRSTKGNGMESMNEEVDVFEEVNVCAILETHIKSKRVTSVCDTIFGRWNWITNMKFYNKGCRIMVGWDENEIRLNVVHMARQSILVQLETVNESVKTFGTFIYAANDGMERKDLWKDLRIYKRIMGNGPWFLKGDMNVTLDPKEHSMSGSYTTCDMKEFMDCVNDVEVEDINSSGLFFTCTKNLHKVKSGAQTGILKKLDRIMGSEDFISRFCNVYALFLPYVISDHCPTVLIIPKSVFPKKKPFKFANFIAEKYEFLHIVTRLWGKVDEGCNMFKIVKNLKGLKKELKQLAWKDGKIFENEESKCLKKYDKAMRAEELILYQKAKVKWFSVRDRNNAYFHKAIKSTIQSNKIDAINDEDGNRYEGVEVVDQFVKHFKKFLGESRLVDPIHDTDSLHIHDNIMLTQELLKGYYRNMGPKRVALKVDIQKAYDIADWSFLEHILKGFVSILKDVIKEFRRVVGLLPNYNKSTIIFGGLTQEEQKDILDIAPFKVEKLLIKYLGVPITSKRLELSYGINMTGDKAALKSGLGECLRLSLAASVYLIWQERNRRIFKDEKRNVDELFSIFKDTIRLRLMSLKVKDSCAVRTVQKERDV
ncbi:RNA-directed DNA polymerase, eukaryota, reverse transcriptase zinc-binding domain protein [Tanacetum coccineum]|uniref:RNA-directed DNA polymerase, eukaryota, reverse transcriptase zinc-binding domain protein n=1 Tax=Tanacetum coccineum TaxID=301880 RepID=A0ABQ4WXN0_9ASTR